MDRIIIGSKFWKQNTKRRSKIPSENRREQVQKYVFNSKQPVGRVQDSSLIIPKGQKAWKNQDADGKISFKTSNEHGAANSLS